LLSLREELTGWRQQISQPLRLDIFVDTGDSALLREAVGAQAHERGTVLLERWWLRYEPAAAEPRGIGWPAFYKRFMVLLRALIGFLPLMPAHRLAASLAKLRGTDALRGSAALLGYRIAVAPTLDGQEPAFPASPAPRQYMFAPPDAQHGRLSLSVAYRCPSLFSRQPFGALDGRRATRPDPHPLLRHRAPALHPVSSFPSRPPGPRAARRSVAT